MRTEKDSLGELKIDDGVYYGIQSYRASQNFQISGTQVHPELIRSYLLLKKAAARANQKVGVLDAALADAIANAIDDLLKGDYLKYFIVDAYQAGAGTSQNMNANEVIANRANEMLGHALGSYAPIHPNDQVNQSQSTNDTYPTAMRLATLTLSRALGQELHLLARCFEKKAQEFDSVLKAARTHLQDAVPIRLGQEFSAYARVCDQVAELIQHAQHSLRELGIGGSAAGTGVNVPAGYRAAIISELQKIFADEKIRLSPNLVAAMQSQLPMMIYSNALRALALELTRIFNDLRLLSSGPTNGLQEITLPSSQPGSSIMPGKVNPSILEMGNQVCFKVLGNDTALAFAIQAGQLELNVMMPVMSQLALESTHLLTNMLRTVRERAIEGITANREQCAHYAESTSQIAAALNPILGYEKAGEIAKAALKKKMSVIALVREQKLLTEAQIQTLLDPCTLTEPKN
jgi:aspartate ammonia-lyase